MSGRTDEGFVQKYGYQVERKNNSKFNLKILIVYLGEHDHQKAMADEIFRGIQAVKDDQSENHHAIINSKISTTSTTNFSEVMDSDAIIIGSPVYNANIHPKIQTWINKWDINADLSSKIRGVFVTAGGMSAGEE